MAEPTGHCPYLGLKQNRAIRFASPTAEHRCYVSGEPLEIPVDQSSFCLSQGHVHCPLYMGLTVPTTSDPTLALAGAGAARAGGVRGWFAALSPRDRLIYTLMLGMLAVIIGIYLLVGVQTLLNRGGLPTIGEAPTSPPVEQPTIDTHPTAAASAPTGVPFTPTDLPTSPAQPTPSAEPTQAPTSQPTQAPTSQPTQVPTQAATSTPAPRPTQPPRPSATSAPAPTQPPVPAPTQPPAATSAPQADLSIKPVTLYFSDPTGKLLVPARRNTQVENNRVAEAALNELIAGPRNGLGRLVSADTGLLGISIDGGRATANFDRDPGGLDSIVFTLTEFPSISSVQIQVNGVNLGGAHARPVLNPINPQNLAVDYGSTEFLPLYFPSATSGYDIRVIRMIPKTKQVAEATVRALLEGPGPYDGALRRVIPAGTELRGIKLENGVVLVDFTQPFADAPDLDAAMRTLVESLTTLKTVGGVQFLVEGQAFADGKIFRRPAINQE